MKRLVLVGYRGTGKTAIGKILAHRFKVPFLDTDTLIETKSGRTIPEIFQTDGEEKFRMLEREVIAGLPTSDVIVSSGGGAILDPRNVEQLRADSTCILLIADAGTISKRITNTSRPALTTLSPDEEIREMLNRRRTSYSRAEDFCVNTSLTTAEQAADKIETVLKHGTLSENDRKESFQWFATILHNDAEREQLRAALIGGGGNNVQTRLLGIAGWPCKHSRGPLLFNQLFSKYHLNYHYTRFEDPAIARIIQIAKSVDAKGLSVTIPFKQDVMAHLDEIDEAARDIGAVNTVVFSCNSTKGYNTDWIGIRKPLEQYKGSRAVILGAGGVAAAAVYALLDLDMDITILNRTPEKARSLADRLGCNWDSWETFSHKNPELVLNATSLGMEPDTSSPLRADQLKKEITIFDLVYTPPVTPLIAAARKIECNTITGTEIFIYQAQEQFRLFFGITVPETVIREILA